MKKIFCPKCDEAIVLSDARLSELRASDQGYIALVCPSCTHQLRIRLKAAPAKASERATAGEHYGHIVVLENSFGYKQYFPLHFGINRIGRRNKDTVTDIPIVTGDPSMDRHHAIIRVSKAKSGRLLWSLSDDESRVGTFVANELLGARQWYNLSDGDVFTLGATTLIFSTAPVPTPEEAIEGEGVH